MDYDFSDEAILNVTPLPKALDVKYSDVYGGKLSPEEVSRITIAASSTAGITALKGLRERILSLIHMHSCKIHPVSLGTLNRMYGRIASKLDTNVRTCVDYLCAAEYAVMLDDGTKRGLMSKVVWDEIQVSLGPKMPPDERFSFMSIVLKDSV